MARAFAGFIRRILFLLIFIILTACGGVETASVEPPPAATPGPPTFEQLVAEAMGGGFDPDSLEPGRADALEQLRQTFFVREYDTDGDQQLDGPILSELGENTVQWAVDGVTPYLAGKEINDVYGGGTDTALLESGFRPGEPLVVSVAGANAELANQGVPANGVHLVVMSPTQAVVTDERSNPVAEVGADGVWRAREVVVTEVPTETPTEEPTVEPTATPIPEPYSHIATAPDGSALQEYLNASGARVEPAIHLGEGAFELVPAGEVLPTHVYEPEIGNWRKVDRDKALIDRVSTSTWFTATGSVGTIYEGLTMPMRVTTSDIPHLQEIIGYAPEVQEYFMVNWLRMSHVAHTYQQRGNEAAVDFETYVQMVKDGDPNASIYVYRYDLNPDGTRGALRQQWVDPAKGVTIQAVYDREFENHPLATVSNPNNTGDKHAFMLGVSGVGQAVVAMNIDTEWIDGATDVDREDRMMAEVLTIPTSGMMWVPMYATGYMMRNPDVTAPGFELIGQDLSSAAKLATEYSREQLGIDWENWNQGLVSVNFG